MKKTADGAKRGRGRPPKADKKAEPEPKTDASE